MLVSLNKTFRLDRPLIVFDTETTGVGPEDRIIEIGFQVHKPDTDTVVEWRSLVNPGRPIPPEATAVHNITDEMVTFGCRHCGKLPADHSGADPISGTPVGLPTLLGATECRAWERTWTFAEIARNLAHGFTGADLAGKRVRFDIGKFEYEFTLAGVVWDRSAARVIDLDRIEQLGEPRTLSVLYERRIGRPAVGAHGALSDVRMTTELLAHDMALFGALPRDLGELHALQWPGWIDPDGKFRFDDAGVPRVAFGQKYPGWEMRKVPRGFWTWMMGAKFTTAEKAIAEAALAGRFPVRAQEVAPGEPAAAGEESPF